MICVNGRVCDNVWNAHVELMAFLRPHAGVRDSNSHFSRRKTTYCGCHPQQVFLRLENWELLSLAAASFLKKPLVQHGHSKHDVWAFHWRRSFLMHAVSYLVSVSVYQYSVVFKISSIFRGLDRLESKTWSGPHVDARHADLWTAPRPKYVKGGSDILVIIRWIILAFWQYGLARRACNPDQVAGFCRYIRTCAAPNYLLTTCRWLIDTKTWRYDRNDAFSHFPESQVEMEWTVEI